MVSLARRICSFQCFSKSTKRRIIIRRRRRRGDNLVAKVIPFDIQIEILTRLPPTSLCKFKCVSKLWFSLIRSRWFSNRYLTVASPRGPPSRYVSLVDHHYCDSMESCDKPGNSALLTLSNYSSCNGGLVMPGIGGHRMVVLRGLILYSLCYKACIYNPATRQSLTLPPVQSNLFAQEEGKKDVFYYLGHDPVLDQYKVLCTVLLSKEVDDDDDDDDDEYMTSEHWVFLLEARGSWKRLVFDNHDHCPTRLGMCINGVIHYLAVTPTSRDNLVSFDVRSEEFSMIQAPDEVGESVGFIEYDGKPTIVDHTHIIQTGLVNLWVFQGTTWPKKVLVLETCKMQLFDKTTELWVAGTTRKGEVIFVPRGWSLPFYTLYYDLKRNELRKVTIIEREPPREYHGVTDHPVYYYTELEDKSENILHLEI